MTEQEIKANLNRSVETQLTLTCSQCNDSIGNTDLTLLLDHAHDYSWTVDADNKPLCGDCTTEAAKKTEGIGTSYWRPDNQWIATEDSYDGAPDANPRDKILGRGNTEAEAIADLKRQIAEVSE